MYSDNSKYIVEEMESTNDDDYKLIKKSFEDTMYRNDIVETHKIYRVKQRNSDEASEQTSNNMLLFHGTDVNGVSGILEEGFRPSFRGSCGPGVYLTASPTTAFSYSVSKTRRLTKRRKRKSTQSKDAEEHNVLLRMLVNEVLESEKLKVDEYQQNKTHQFARYKESSVKRGKATNAAIISTIEGKRRKIQKKDSDEIAKEDSDETFENDSNGRQIKTSRATERDNSNHYVCNEHFVIPRYLIEFYSQTSL